MSDPVTTAEVEDVLSSIRRLVSEDKRPLQPAETSQQADRLVLTPALRVQDDQPKKEAAKSGIQEAFESEHAEDAVLNDRLATDMPHLADNAKLDALGPSEKDHANAERSGILNLTPADLANDSPDAPDDHDENEPDHVAVALPPLTLQPELRRDAEWAADALAEAEAVAETTKSSEETAEQAVDDGVVKEATMTATKAATLSAKIEALESAIGGIEDDFEPDEVSDDAYSGTHAPALAWEDDLEGELENIDMDGVSVEMAEEVFATDLIHDVAEDSSPDAEDISIEMANDITNDTVKELHQPIQEAVTAAATAELASADEDDLEFAGETRILDEDALRDMVGDIVRLELQGALGERITRNVRKLVRREIHRALTTQELD